MDTNARIGDYVVVKYNNGDMEHVDHENATKIREALDTDDSFVGFVSIEGMTHYVRLETIVGLSYTDVLSRRRMVERQALFRLRNDEVEQEYLEGKLTKFASNNKQPH